MLLCLAPSTFILFMSHLFRNNHRPSTLDPRPSTDCFCRAGTWTGYDALVLHNNGARHTQGFNMMPSALLLEASQDVLVEHCHVRRLGGAGITIAGGSGHSSVRSCLLEDISGSAVQLGGTVVSKSL